MNRVVYGRPPLVFDPPSDAVQVSPLIPGSASLEVMESRALQAGDFYELLPETDIHRVRTTSDITSVSLHLLGIDNGCIWRHQFLPDEGKVVPIKSGYLNEPCADETQA